VVLCAGAWSESLLERSSIDISGVRKGYFGVGSALLLRSELDYVSSPRIDRIYRTPNRGGTCGIHSVQREDSVYVGASSVVTNVPLKFPRASSVLNLISGACSMINIDCHQLSVDIITGYRPVTDDAVPNIGNLSETLFCCYGTKRDGFTWSPYFADLIAATICNSSTLDPDFNEILDMCNPVRPMTSAGSPQTCIENYVINKIYEAAQHGIRLGDTQIMELRQIASTAHEKIKSLTGDDIGIQPEIVNMIYYRK